MADTDKVSINYVEETVEGTTPGTPSMIALRFAGESLKQNTDTENSDEIDPGAQLTDVTRTDVSAGGSLDCRMSYGTYDDFIEAAYRNTWTSDIVVVSASTAVTVTNSTTLTLGSGSWTNTPTVGSWIQISGFADQVPATTYGRVGAATGTTITTDHAILIAELSGDTVTITEVARVTNGTTDRSFTLEKKFADADGAGTDEWARYNGSVVSGMTTGASVRQSIRATFEIVAYTEASASATLDASPTAAPTGAIFSSVSDLPLVLEGTAQISTGTEVNSTITNNVEAEPALGILGAHRIRRGKFQESGTLKRYFRSEALIDKYLNWTSTGLATVVAGPSGTYIFDRPRVKIVDASRVTPGPNQSVYADTQWQAYKHETLGFTSQVCRIA